MKTIIAAALTTTLLATTAGAATLDRLSGTTTSRYDTPLYGWDSGQSGTWTDGEWRIDMYSDDPTAGTGNWFSIASNSGGWQAENTSLFISRVDGGDLDVNVGVQYLAAKDKYNPCVKTDRVPGKRVRVTIQDGCGTNRPSDFIYDNIEYYATLNIDARKAKPVPTTMPAAVPVPPALALMLSGLLGMGVVARRKARA